MEALLQDVRYGIRSLLKSSSFTIPALLTLALGIGANTAMFSVIHSVLLKPWPFQALDRVFVVWQRLSNGNINAFSTPDLLDWKEQARLSLLLRLNCAGTNTSSLSGFQAPSSPMRCSRPGDRSRRRAGKTY